MKRALLVVMGFGTACNGASGTLEVGLVTAPGSKLLDADQPADLLVDTLTMIITAPRSETVAERVDGGFTLSADLPAAGGSGQVIVEGKNAAGDLVAYGQSPPFAVAGITAKLVIYMATPLSIGVAPLTLSPARSDLTVGAVSSGCLFVGGRLASGAPSDATAVYNAYDHSITAGVPMLAPRAGVAMALDATGHAVLFGGTGSDGQPTDTMWSFDTTVAPMGAFSDLGDQAGFARTDQIALFTGAGEFIISGNPVVEFSSATSTLVARTDVSNLSNVGVGLTTSDGVVTAVFGGAGLDGDTGYTVFRDDVVSFPTGGDPNLMGGAMAAIPDDQVVLAGGTDITGNTSLFELDPTTSAQSVLPTGLTARFQPGAAATSRYLVIAGGIDPNDDETTLDTVDIVSLSTAPTLMATLKMAQPRSSPTLIALPNDQVLIAGGVDENNQPIETLELFTPDPPPDL